MQTLNTTDPRDLFSGDRPIPDRASDKLERRSFAEALAQAVRGWQGRNSLVIALYGPWGSGKSSIKNMVIEDIRKQPGESVPTVAEFNPWQFANREQLTEAFFDQIGLALGKGTCGSEKDKKRLLKRWRRYSASLRAGAGLVAHIRGASVAALLPGLLGVGIAASPIQHAAGWATAILVGLGAVLGWSHKSAEFVAGFVEAGADIGKRSLEEVKEALSSELHSLKAPLLVVIDDVDRLIPAEAQELFQLIKVNADFPNLVYLVLCDRSVVEKNIEKVLAVSGRDYLEKIVQVGFDVPAVQRSQLHRVLLHELNELMAEPAISRRIDKRRWGNIFFGGLQAHFNTLRDVNRFLSSLSFHVSLFRTEKSFEVNPVDLISIEVLRVFHPEVYRAIAGSKHLLTEEVSEADREEDHRNALLAIAQLAAHSKEAVTEIIKQLFPVTEWVFGEFQSVGAFEESWNRELRVCSEKFFDRYFRLTIAEDDISQATIDRILGLTNDRECLRAELFALKARGLLPLVLERLEAYEQDIPLEHAESFITALFDSCDDISSPRSALFPFSPMTRATRIVFRFLRREPDARVKARMLDVAIRASEGISLPVALLSNESQKRRRERGLHENLTDDEGLSTLQRSCLEKIEAAALSGQLAGRLELSLILFQWKEWGGDMAPKAFAAAMASTPDGAISFLRAFLLRSTFHGLGDHVEDERWDINLNSIETFLPWESIDEVTRGVPLGPPDANDGHLALRAFREAVKRQREGTPERAGDFKCSDDE